MTQHLKIPIPRSLRSSSVHADPAKQYRETRGLTEALCRPLQPEDYVIQVMEDASPTKWHLAHTTWFFETFVLSRFLPGYDVWNRDFQFLFNSYYDAVGERIARNQRGVLSRPGVEEVHAYRHAIDEQMLALLSECPKDSKAEIHFLTVLGLNHEQQHQELILTDIKHGLSHNPLRPAYRQPKSRNLRAIPAEAEWHSFPAGIRWIGHDNQGFAYDNESPRHRVFVEAFEVSPRLVTVGEYLRFIEDGGYQSSRYWLSEGWNHRSMRNWAAPLYWEKRNSEWQIYTLEGLRDLNPDEPVSHLSYYEADAFARWSGARLPTEAEWRALADLAPLEGNFLESDHLHPIPAQQSLQIFGEVWEWTSSPYTAYPGFRPLKGALGEYNGKFMCNQMVLRGGSCATPQSHLRRSYRNFFPPQARWQFSGLRLAKSL